MADQQSSLERKFDEVDDLFFEENGAFANEAKEKEISSDRRAFAETFSFRQVGSISKYIEPISVAQPIAYVISTFEENPDIQAVPVEEYDVVVGYIDRTSLEVATNGFFNRLLPKGTGEYVKRVSLVLYANEFCEQCLSKTFAAAKESGAIYFPVFYSRKVFYGLASLDNLIERISEVREQDLQRAREIQQGIMPDAYSLNALPFDVHAWNRMANPIGGDIYTVFKVSEKRYIAGCFDVAGKNVAAALITVAVNSFFEGLKIFHQAASSPQKIIAELDRFIEDTVPLGTFVTAGIFFVDMEAKKLAIFNCGHTAIYFFVPGSLSNGKRTIMVSEVEAYLPPLGMGTVAASLEGGDVKIPACTIEKGLKAYMYTDGLEDMQTEDGARYGSDRIKSLFKSLYSVSRHEITKKIEAAVDDWTERTMLPDDITVVDVAF